MKNILGNDIFFIGKGTKVGANIAVDMKFDKLWLDGMDRNRPPQGYDAEWQEAIDTTRKTLAEYEAEFGVIQI